MEIRRVVLIGAAALLAFGAGARAAEPRPWINIRGIYGGCPDDVAGSEVKLESYGANAIFIGEGAVTPELVKVLHDQGARIFAEFNTMHVASYVKEHPDAAPIGSTGRVSPPPHGWQGVCPTHEAYRRFRMDAFRKLLVTHELDGVWLDYHHAHASWERPVPKMPDTCFCDRCIEQFAADTRLELPRRPTRDRARLLLGRYRRQWVQWRCDVFTDWIREFRQIIDATRPAALLGTFHCPWSDDDFDGARRDKLAIDLRAQAQYVDVFSPMPYHARFGHADDPEWISRQTTGLGAYLGLQGGPDEAKRIWPIVQLSKWGEAVPVEQVSTVLDHASRPPATGVMWFAWGSVKGEPQKVDAMRAFYLSIAP